MSAAEAAAARAKDPDYILPTKSSQEQKQSKTPKGSTPISSPFQESAGNTQDQGRGEKELHLNQPTA